jgi:hypothetical protein
MPEEHKRKLELEGDVSLEAVLDLAQRAARAAGALVDSVWDKRSDVKDTKSNARDLVTITDEKCVPVTTDAPLLRVLRACTLGETLVVFFIPGARPSW